MIQIDPITDEEQKIIDELKRRTIHELNPRQLQDETFYYRFLKARDFNIKDAEIMIRKHISEDIRIGGHQFLQNYIPEKSHEKYFACTLLGHDFEGSTVYYVDVGGLDVKGILESFNLKEILLHSLYVIANGIDLMTEQTKRGKPANKFVGICNFDKLNLFKVTNKKAIEWCYEAFKCFQDNCPERIKAIYVLNAAFYFHIGYAVFKNVIPDELLKKINIFGKTGWQDALLNIMDADVLPAFLGGNKTDPDGNPLCNSFVRHAVNIPEELYLTKNRNSLNLKTGAKKVALDRLSSSEVLLPVYEKDTHIEWEFEAKARDIDFALSYKEDSTENSKQEILIPKQRVDTRFSTETGIYKCNRRGLYIITFDNTYSWIYSKEIYYKIRLVKPSEISSFDM